MPAIQYPNQGLEEQANNDYDINVNHQGLNHGLMSGAFSRFLLSILLGKTLDYGDYFDNSLSNDSRRARPTWGWVSHWFWWLGSGGWMLGTVGDLQVRPVEDHCRLQIGSTSTMVGEVVEMVEAATVVMEEEVGIITYVRKLVIKMIDNVRK